MLTTREQFAEILGEEIARLAEYQGDPRLLLVGRGFDPGIVDAVARSAAKLGGDRRAATLAAAFFAIGLNCGIRIGEES